MNICTIVCRNYVAQARVLARSFRAVYPDGECVALVLDATEVGEYCDEPFRPLLVSDLGISDFEIMAGIYEAIELSTAVKPWLLAWMDREFGDRSPIAYFDPDIRIASRLVELEAMLEDNWAVLIPHFTRPLPLDDKTPSEQAILLAGTYNLGFIGLRRDPELGTFLAWWQERLARLCKVDPPNGFFVDQRFVDLVPGLFERVGILRHDGYNVAYWNLAARSVGIHRGQTEINGLPLRFFHFSGFDPQSPSVISRHQTRVAMSASPELAATFASYAEDLLSEGFEETSRIPYGFRESALGHQLTASVRRVYAAAVEQGFGGSLFDATGDALFEQWLQQPEPAAGRLSRGLSLLWETTPAIRDQYPDYLYADRAAFLEWCGREGAPTLLLSEYVPSSEGPTRNGFRKRPAGVNVIGYLNAESGVGEAARNTIALLDQAGVPVWPVSLEAPGLPNRHHFRVPGGPPDLPFDRSLVCVNADMLPHLGPALSRLGLTETEVTGLWWWETERLPKRFEAAFAWVGSVVAGSTFVRDAIDRCNRLPVAAFPLPVVVDVVAESMPPSIPWPEGFVFYFSFDYASVFRRKNPLGLVEAYTKAFAPDDGAHLVIKSINGYQHTADQEALRQAVVHRPDIVLIDAMLNEADRNRLTAACDCYVSLHRSEGFGLTMAEAMYLGKPVIATGYSGNMDFMTDENSRLVRFSRERIGFGAEPYDAEEHWAEPDLEHAAVLMREVFDNQGLSQRIGEAAARSIRQTHSTERGAHALASLLMGEEYE